MTPEAVRPICTTEARGTTLVVGVFGEIDLATGPEVSKAVSAALDRNPETLVIDLEDVSFMDSSAVYALLDAQERARARDVRLVVLAAASEEAQMPLALSGLDRSLPVTPRGSSEIR